MEAFSFQPSHYIQINIAAPCPVFNCRSSDSITAAGTVLQSLR